MRLGFKTGYIALALGGALALVGLAAAAPAHLNPPDSKVDFARDVRPILADKCFACHGPDEKHRLGGFRLDQREGDVHGRILRKLLS